MRKRNIKSVAHWVIMSVVLLFPVLMVGISSFGNHETINVVQDQPIYYQTNDVVSYNDFAVGNIYHWKNNFVVTPLDDNKYLFYIENTINMQQQFNVPSTIETLRFYIGGSGTAWFRYETDEVVYVNVVQTPFDFVVYSLDENVSYVDNIIQYFSSSEMLLIKEYQRVEYVQNYYMREDVNQWCNTFRNLAVNQWYGDLLDTIGLGITNSMMMNVIYTYPLYVLWVYIIDLVVDCLLVIINFGHNALKRLGGDNE